MNPSLPVYMYILAQLDSSIALKMPTERPNKNSDRKKKSDFKSDTSRNKIIYKANCQCTLPENQNRHNFFMRHPVQSIRTPLIPRMRSYALQ